MTTLRDLQYVLEANTKGLQTAVPVLEKLVAKLEDVAKASSNMAAQQEQAQERVARASRDTAGEQERNARRTENAMARQAAAANAAMHRVQAMNDAIRAKQGESHSIQQNTVAMTNFIRTMQSGVLTAAEYRRALTELNNTTAIGKRGLAVFNQQNREANDAARATTAILKSQEAARRTADATLAKETTTLQKQENALARVRQRYLDLQKALEDVKASPQRMAVLNSSFSDFEKKMKSGALTSAEFSKATNEVNAKFGDIRRASNIANPALQNVITRMNDLTSSAQVALGPLSGVASRISAITTLASRASLAAAGIITAFIAFGTALGLAIREGAQFEQQLLRINAVLDATGHAAGLTSERVLEITDAIAKTTMATQDQARDAAASLLTNTKVTGQLFENAMKAAQGLSLIGRGDIVSQIRRVSRGLEDPAENLKALTEAGIYYNSVEERKIKTLQASGRMYEAQALWLEKTLSIQDAAVKENEGLAGSWQNLTESFTDFFEKAAVESGLIDVLTDFIKYLTKWINDLANSTGAATALGKAFVLVMKALIFVVKGATFVIEAFVLVFEKLINLGVLDWLQSVAAAMTGNFAKAGYYAAQAIKKIDSQLNDIDGKEVEVTVVTNTVNKEGKGGFEPGELLTALLAKVKRTTTNLSASIVDVGLPFLELDESLKENADNWSRWQLTVLNTTQDMRDAIEKELSLPVGAIDRMTMILRTGLNTELGQYNQNLLKGIQTSQDAARAAGALGAAKTDVAEQQRIYNDLMSEGFTHEEALRVATTGATDGLENLTPAMVKLANGTVYASDQMRTFNDEAARMTEIVNGQLALQVAQQELALVNAGEAVRNRELAVLKKRNDIMLAGRDATAEELSLTSALVDAQTELGHLQSMRSLGTQIATQEKQLTMFGMTNRMRQDGLAILNKENELVERYGSLMDERAQKEMAAYQQSLALARQIEGMEGLLDTIERGFDDSFLAVFDWITGAEDGFEALKETAVKALKDIAQEILKTFVMTPIKNALFGALGGAGIGGLGGSGPIAFGGAINNMSTAGSWSNLSGAYAGMYAKGGRIPRGKWGVVGENGPEAVFAGAGGASVRANGDGSPVINIIEAPGTKATATPNADGGVDVIISIVKKEIAKYDKNDMPKRFMQLSRDPRGQ